MADVEAILVKIRPGQSLTGTVSQITDDEVCVNIGFKSDGPYQARRTLVTQDVKMGDVIEVEVVKVIDGEGNVLLSQRNILTRKRLSLCLSRNTKRASTSRAWARRSSKAA
jgi:4-hydroxy-3-methylbut-2-enyl diphosphate reductase